MNSSRESPRASKLQFRGASLPGSYIGIPLKQLPEHIQVQCLADKDGIVWTIERGLRHTQKSADGIYPELQVVCITSLKPNDETGCA